MTDDKNNGIITDGTNKADLINSYEFALSIYTPKFLESLDNYGLIENHFSKVEAYTRLRYSACWKDEDLKPIYSMIFLLEEEILRRLEKGQKMADCMSEMIKL